MGRGLDFSTPPAYIRASTMQFGAEGGRSMERKHLPNRAQVGVEGRGGRVAERSRDAKKGSGASQRAEWGPPPEKGRRGGHSREEFAGASAIQSVNSLKGASAIPLSHTELCAERAPVTPVSPGGHRHC